MPDTAYDVLVLGAGAAGLVAAIRAAELGARTLLVEKNRRPGVKILMSGGTRCNITHNCDDRGIVEAYGPPGKFLHSALAAFGVREAIELFEAEGVATKVEEYGKVFPVSNRAADVLDALVKRLERSGAAIALDEAVTDVSREASGWRVVTTKRTLIAARIVLTTGGKSYPGSGTTGDGYRWAAALGHTIIPPRPALTPITTNTAWVRELRGLTLPDITLTVFDGDKKLATRRGSLLFAHFGLTGPVALDVSRVVSGHAQPATLRIELDLAPVESEMELNKFLQKRSLADGKKQLATILAEKAPHRLAHALLALADQPIDRKAAGLNRGDRAMLAQLIKRMPVAVAGTLGFEKAEVTAGGVALAEVDSRTLQSKLARGFFLAGEVLDLDGPIGGYNFQAAWSTGWLAGESAAGGLRRIE